MTIPLRVLIVEDSPEDAELILLELRKAMFEPVAQRVETGEALRETLQGNHWDVILSDHSMPRFNAARALGITRQAGIDLPFIVVSGAISDEAVAALMKGGAHNFVRKGNLSQLGPVVERELLDAAARRDERHAAEERRRLMAELDAANRQLRVLNESLQAQLTSVFGSLAEMTERETQRIGDLPSGAARDRFLEFISQVKKLLR